MVIGNFIQNIRRQFDRAWGGLSTQKKLILAGGIALLVIGGVFIAIMAQSTEWEYLFVNMNESDVKEVTSYLHKNDVEYKVNKSGILVSKSQVMDLRLKLSQEGIPTSGHVGWETFDTQDFSRTEFEQQIQKVRAIQGELGRTIQSIEGVSSARVHIVVPRKSLFVEDQKTPTASVYIKTKRGLDLESKQIKGIVHMVSKAVEGLEPENIAIIDHEGKMLTKIESKDPTQKRTDTMLRFKKSLESEMEERVRVIVGRVVGPDRVEAKVDVQIDYTQEEVTISDIDPDKAVVIASNSTNQQMSGNGLNPTGIPGSKSNVPGEQEEVLAGSSSSKGSRSSERLNYDVSKSVSHKVLPVGTITSISAAVLVDGKQAYPTDGSQPELEARTPEEMNKIEELVKNAIGYKDGRDKVVVHNMLFQLDPYQVQSIKERKRENREYISTLAISGAIALALVFFFAFIVRPYFRWLSYDPDRKRDEAIVEEFKPDLELGGIQNVQVKEDVPFEKLTPQEQVLFLAKNEPQRTTEAIRILLNPHAS